MIKSFEKEVCRFEEVLNANLTEKVGESVTRVKDAFPEGSYAYVMVSFTEFDKNIFVEIVSNIHILNTDNNVSVEGVIVFKFSTSTFKVEVLSVVGGKAEKITSNLASFLNPDIVYEMLEVIEKVRKKAEMKKKIEKQISQVNAL